MTGDLVALEALANQLALALAYDPRFQQKASDEVSTLRFELSKLKEEMAKLKDTGKVSRQKVLEDTADPDDEKSS
jgi:hypothetical protein